MSLTMGQWTKVSEYCLSHPSGWTIAKCYVLGSAKYVLWQGETRRGQFDDVRDAMREHTRLVPPTVEHPDDDGDPTEPQLTSV
ncbi:hypothetical protein [Paraburkholderia fungorum]|uniref:hypothetical protein n=1 Tax=Paraburkholderia fungorum TaxID=134537 RepID=UPI00241F791E|nr:hypothetical protein [Paraburkholderia fungorum]